MTSSPNIPERYEILGELGSGGMGSVYRVHDSSLNQTFALKVLHFTGSTAGSEIVRFQKEAKAAASLQHENIMRIIDFGYHEKTTPYMVLEYVEGRTLQQRINEMRSLSLEEAAEIFEQTARALSFAHSRNIVHRDLKSSNILLTKGTDGNTLVKLFDFGIARVLEEPASMHLTATDAIIGTPKYMSPEQARGKKADARSDIYSFGCVMFETLTGRLPFKADSTLELLDMQINTAPPKLGAIKSEFKDSPIEKLIDQCLQKGPDDRFQSANEILEFLRSPPSADSEQHPVPVSLTTTKKPWKIVAFCGAIAVVTLIAFVVQFIKNDETRNQKTSPAIKNKPVLSKKSSVTPLKKRKIEHWIVEDGKVQTVHLQNQDNDFNASDGDLSRIPITVRELDITDVPPTNALFNEIAKLQFLTDIKMHKMEVNSTQVASLKNLPNLRFISAKGANFDNISDLRQLQTLEDLGLAGLSPAEIAILGGLPKLSKLTLEPELLSNVPLSKEMITALTKLKTLETLKIVRGDQVATDALPLFASMTKLGNLAINHTPTIAGGIPYLAKLKLWKLELRNDGLTDQNIKQLAEMASLTHLDISENLELTDKAIEYLYKSPKLKWLRIVDTRFSPGAVKTLKNNRARAGEFKVFYKQSKEKFEEEIDD